MKKSFFIFIAIILLPVFAMEAKSQEIKGGLSIEFSESDMLPKSINVLQNIRVGWNLGNTFEAIPEETSWGNPRTSQKLIDFVKSLGFNAIRIPIAVNAHTDKNNNISKAWLKRVAQVVDYCIKDSMYVILSCSYTEGWIKFDGGKDYDLKQIVAIRNIWEQIAMQMAAYDEHLIFAFASRLSVSDISYLDKFILLQQNFIDAVRQTGGKNMYRTLLIQGPNLDMAETVKYMHLPSDYNEGYLGVEVAYYTPWNFCGLKTDESWGNYSWFWGEKNRQKKVDGVDRNSPGWSEENYMSDYFSRIGRKFVQKGIPVVIGECGVIHRSLPNAKLQKAHENSRYLYMFEYTKTARNNGIVPFIWDDGQKIDNNMCMIRRQDFTIFDSNVLQAIMDGVQKSEYPKNK